MRRESQSSDIGQSFFVTKMSFQEACCIECTEVAEQLHMSEENNALFKDIFVYRDDSEWVEYENSTRVKRLCPKLFVATQVFETIGDRYMCYCFRINLNDYSEQHLEMQRNNNIRLERLLPDEEFFTAAAVLAMIPPEDAVNVRIASGKLELDNWYISKLLLSLTF